MMISNDGTHRTRVSNAWVYNYLRQLRPLRVCFNPYNPRVARIDMEEGVDGWLENLTVQQEEKHRFVPPEIPVDFGRFW